MRRVLAVAFLLLAAGCFGLAPDGAPEAPGPSNESAPSASTSDTDDGPTVGGEEATGPRERPIDPGPVPEAPPVEVTGGQLAADPGLVFARTELLLGVNVTPVESVVVRPEGEMALDSTRTTAFQELVGVTYRGDRDSLVAAASVEHPSRIAVNERFAGDPGFADVLAHEAVHVIQIRQGDVATVGRNVPRSDADRFTTDARLVRLALIEGAATYAQTAYWEAYVNEGVPPDRSVGRRYANATGAERLWLAPYHFGVEHVDRTVDDPEELDDVYEDPPRTTADLLAGTRDEQLDELRVAVDAGNWTELSRDRMGELFLRVMLATYLSDREAAAAADGWRDDRLVELSAGPKQGYAWVVGFEDGPAAGDFAGAFEATLESRGARTENGGLRLGDDAFRVVPAGRDTVVVLLGDPGFVNGTTIERDADGIVVSPPPA